MRTILLLSAALAFYGCQHCADLREVNPTNPMPHQIAHLCFTSRAAMATAIATGVINPAEVLSHSVCYRSTTEIPDGIPCPKVN